MLKLDFKYPAKLTSFLPDSDKRKFEAKFIHTYIYIHMEMAMAPHSSTLAWKIPLTEEPGRLQSTGLLRVGHD